MKTNDLIVVRGAGDLATGTIQRLASAGFSVLALEIPEPAAIRRTVALSEALWEGRVSVENVVGIGISDIQSIYSSAIMSDTHIVPILPDPEGKAIWELRPAVVVDAILAKRNLGTCREMAPLTIGLGPGFTAGEDVDHVIETQRGHDLGRIITTGSAQPNTGIPGIIAGYGAERVLHSPGDGIIRCYRKISDVVEKGDLIADIVDTSSGKKIPVTAALTGLLRGLIRDGYPVTKGFKIGDIDPRKEEKNNCFTISDKARCIAGSVLELVCCYFNQRDKEKD